MNAKIIGDTILSQLGGTRFIVMTGAKNFVTAGDDLRFSLPKAIRNKINMVKINLNVLDLYDVTFYNYKKSKFEAVEVSVFQNVYAEDLCRIFTDETGYETRL